jgi:hypothetical protein
MTLIDIVVILILVGLALWLVNSYIPMAAGIKSLLNIVVFVVVLIWLLQEFGLISHVPIRIPPLKSLLVHTSSRARLRLPRGL